MAATYIVGEISNTKNLAGNGKSSFGNNHNTVWKINMKISPTVQARHYTINPLYYTY